jgi:hypothetical protein
MAPGKSSSPPRSAPPDAELSLGAAWSSLSRAQRAWMRAWWALLVVPSLVALVVFGGQVRRNYVSSAQRHADRLNPLKNDAVATQLDVTPPPGHEHDVPTEVKVGVYVTRISELSIVHSSWNADFFAWFAWDGGDASLEPGESFQIVGGQVVSRTLLRRSATGGHHYALYRVTAQITKDFDVGRFPRDEHQLTLTLEDHERQPQGHLLGSGVRHPPHAHHVGPVLQDVRGDLRGHRRRPRRARGARLR